MLELMVANERNNANSSVYIYNQRNRYNLLEESLMKELRAGDSSIAGMYTNTNIKGCIGNL